MSMPFELHVGDCLEVIRKIPDNSVDSIVTDPPYGLSQHSQADIVQCLTKWLYGEKYEHGKPGFMAKNWDSFCPGPEVWRECLRVLKPGGHLLAFFGGRTYDIGTLAIRLAGFEIRDQIMWIYGSGFCKTGYLKKDGEQIMPGWGGSLKPAHEPIVVARKPFAGTMIDNVMRHGTGALNIDGCRVDNESTLHDSAPTPRKNSSSPGRWPANIIHDGSDDVLAAFPAAPGQLADVSINSDSPKTNNVYGSMRRERGDELSANGKGARRLDKGSAARFFYCAKASRRDRNEGLEDPGPQFKHGATLRAIENTSKKGNTHPTVKPTELMVYLCRLVTPPGGTILDLYMGSGSTGKAAIREGFRFIGIDMEKENVDISEARISHEYAITQSKEK